MGVRTRCWPLLGVVLGALPAGCGGFRSNGHVMDMAGRKTAMVTRDGSARRLSSQEAALPFSRVPFKPQEGKPVEAADILSGTALQARHKRLKAGKTEKLYHVTTLNNCFSILQSGIRPGSVGSLGPAFYVTSVEPGTEQAKGFKTVNVGCLMVCKIRLGRVKTKTPCHGYALNSLMSGFKHEHLLQEGYDTSWAPGSCLSSTPEYAIHFVEQVISIDAYEFDGKKKGDCIGQKVFGNGGVGKEADPPLASAKSPPNGASKKQEAEKQAKPEIEAPPPTKAVLKEMANAIAEERGLGAAFTTRLQQRRLDDNEEDEGEDGAAGNKAKSPKELSPRRRRSGAADSPTSRKPVRQERREQTPWAEEPSGARGKNKRKGDRTRTNARAKRTAGEKRKSSAKRKRKPEERKARRKPERRGKRRAVKRRRGTFKKAKSEKNSAGKAAPKKEKKSGK